jgi:rod shape determining protein RodA
MTSAQRSLVRFEWTFLIIPLLLTGLGLTMIYTLSLAQSRPTLFWTQLTSAGLSLLIFGLLISVRLRLISDVAPVFYGVAFALLASLPAFGRTVFGATRWLEFGPFQIQPAEFMKVGLVLLLARLLAGSIGAVRWRQYWLALVCAAAPIAFVIAQPDLGSAIVLAAVLSTFLLASRLRPVQLVVSLLLIVAALLGGWATLRDYQRTRIEAFLHPNNAGAASTYNVRQSLIAVGSGGVTGLGIGRGSQSQLQFLPVSHTDFMFATVAESVGFLGSTLLIGLYGVLIWRCFATAAATSDQFGSLVAVGTGSLLMTQGIIHVGMNIGLLPVTGIPLPFVSHGGSALIAQSILLGSVASVSRS